MTGQERQTLRQGLRNPNKNGTRADRLRPDDHRVKVDTHGIIPTHRLAHIIRPHIQQLGMRTAAQLTGIHERRLNGILRNEYATCSLSTADRLLTRLDLVDFWHLPADEGGLADVYPAATLPPAWAKARQLREQGWTYQRIGCTLGVDHTTVMYWCDDYFRTRKCKQQTRRDKDRRMRSFRPQLCPTPADT